MLGFSGAKFFAASTRGFEWSSFNPVPALVAKLLTGLLTMDALSLIFYSTKILATMVATVALYSLTNIYEIWLPTSCEYNYNQTSLEIKRHPFD